MKLSALGAFGSRLLMAWLGLSTILSSSTALAQPPSKVLLVTSVDGFRTAQSLPWVLGFMANYYRNYNHGLEKIFREFFKDRGFIPEVIHYTDQYHLATLLHSPDYAGIYLVSHEGSLDSSISGMTRGGIYDYDGNEITPVLSEIHPNVKVLAMVGCNSLPLARRLDAQLRGSGVSPELQLLGFDRKVDAAGAMKAALKASMLRLARAESREPECVVKQGYPLRIRRTCPTTPSTSEATSPAVRIESAGKVIAVLPHCGSGEKQSVWAFISAEDIPVTASAMKIQITSGINAYGQAPGALGTFELTRPGQLPGEWQIFAKPDGTPFGTSTHSYRYRGALPQPLERQTYQLFRGLRCPRAN